MASVQVALGVDDLYTLLRTMADYTNSFGKLLTTQDEGWRQQLVALTGAKDFKTCENSVLSGLMALYVTTWDALVGYEMGKRHARVDPAEVSKMYKVLLERFVENVSLKTGERLEKVAKQEDALGATLLKIRNVIAHGKVKITDDGMIRFFTDFGGGKNRAVHDATMTKVKFWKFCEFFERALTRYVTPDEKTRKPYSLDEAVALCVQEPQKPHETEM